HALFDDRANDASPYFPNSRLFLNPLYIDVEAVPEFPGIDVAGLRDVIDELRSRMLVDHARVAEAKTRALRLAYEVFRRGAAAERRESFERFRGAPGCKVSQFASFEVLRRKFEGPWWNWPDRWGKPDDITVDELRRTDQAAVEFFEFVQWIA